MCGYRSNSWRAALDGTRRAIARRIASLSGRADHEWYSALEEALIAADVGPSVAGELVSALRDVRAPAGVDPSSFASGELCRMIARALEPSDKPLAPPGVKPWVILVAGVNGTGKTTTIGKLARLFRADGKSVLLGACDTFRAAAIDQLGVWAKRSGADFVRGAAGGDPAAVAFDSCKAAASRGHDVVILDTAGRLHTRANLMSEIEKVSRVCGKAVDGAPHDVWLVLDAVIGRNAVVQAAAFARSLPITGIVLAKLDGSAKGGVVVEIARSLKLPVRYVGVGEGLDDIVPFDAREFARALCAVDDE